jgi:hypothetical protein
MVQENMASMREQLERKDMTNRLRALDNRPPIPDTEQESMARRLQNLGGKRKRKTVSKRKRREKTRKSRKGRKTNRRRK